MKQEDIMKNITRTYIITLLIFLVPFLLLSISFAVLSYFIQLNTFYTNHLIQILSYVFLILSAIYLANHISSRRFIYCGLFAVVYFLCSLFIHLGDIHWLHLISKPLIFIIIALFKQYRE